VELLTDILVVIDVIASLGLIFLILLHSGRGGGLSDMFGGASAVGAGSNVVERNLDRITILFLEIFAFASIIIALRWT
jgi:preprotein translocase subunit SecG